MRSYGLLPVPLSGKPVHLSRPVQKLYPLEIRSSSEDGKLGASAPVHEDKNKVVGNLPKRSAALDSGWKTRIMLDS